MRPPQQIPKTVARFAVKEQCTFAGNAVEAALAEEVGAELACGRAAHGVPRVAELRALHADRCVDAARKALLFEEAWDERIPTILDATANELACENKRLKRAEVSGQGYQPAATQELHASGVPPASEEGLPRRCSARSVQFSSTFTPKSPAQRRKTKCGAHPQMRQQVPKRLYLLSIGGRPRTRQGRPAALPRAARRAYPSRHRSNLNKTRHYH